jgi:hypothetical protein
VKNKLIARKATRREAVRAIERHILEVSSGRGWVFSTSGQRNRYIELERTRIAEIESHDR